MRKLFWFPRWRGTQRAKLEKPLVFEQRFLFLSLVSFRVLWFDHSSLLTASLASEFRLHSQELQRWTLSHSWQELQGKWALLLGWLIEDLRGVWFVTPAPESLRADWGKDWFNIFVKPTFNRRAQLSTSKELHSWINNSFGSPLKRFLNKSLIKAIPTS